MPAFDYRSMLARYLKLVVDCEGTDFLPASGFTGDEVAEMTRLADEGDRRPPVSYRRKTVLPVLRKETPRYRYFHHFWLDELWRVPANGKPGGGRKEGDRWSEDSDRTLVFYLSLSDSFTETDENGEPFGS